MQDTRYPINGTEPSVQRIGGICILDV